MSQYRTGTARVIPNATVLAAPGAAEGSAGNVDVGLHSWIITAVHANGGETIAGTSVSLAVVSSAKQVNLSSVPIGPAGTASRKIYRTISGDTGSRKFVGSIANNSGTTFTDNVADASLATATAPTASTFPTDTVELTGGGATTGNILLNNLFKFQGENLLFTISSVSVTYFLLSTVYNGAKISGTYYPYIVAKDFTPTVSLPLMAAGDVDTPDIFTRAMRLLDTLIVDDKILNVKNFGAVGDGVADDSVAFQAAINATAPGQIIRIPIGTYKIGTQLDILLNTIGGLKHSISFVGDGSQKSGSNTGVTLKWSGGTATTMINLRSRDCVFEGITFKKEAGGTLTCLIDIDNPTGAGAENSTHNLFRRCRFEGVSAEVTNGIRMAFASSTNVEYMRFEHCDFNISGTATRCILIGNNPNSMMHRFEYCGFSSAAYGVDAGSSGHFLTFMGCSFGSLTSAGVKINGPATFIDCDEESCARLIEGASTGAPFPVNIIGGRFTLSGLHGDGRFIDMPNPGPLVVHGATFPGYNSSFKIRIGSGSNEGGVLVALGNHFANESPFEFSNGAHLVSLGNLGWTSGVLFPVLLPTIRQESVTGGSDEGHKYRKFQVDRIDRSKGTTPVAGDFALSAGWGSTASVGSISGNDNRLRFTVTSAGTGQGANPTITFTFKDKTWTAAPFAIVSRNGGSQATVVQDWTTTATTFVITWRGTPVAAETFTFEVQVTG